MKSKCGRIGLSIAAVAKTVEPSLHAGPGPPGPSASISCGTHRHGPGRTCHPPQPAGNGRIPRQIEPRFIRAMGMGEQRDVGNAVGIASPMDHGCPHRCCSITASASSPRISRCGQLRFPRMPGRQKVPDETGRGHMRLMAVLLEEHPAQGLRALPRIIRQAGRTSGQPEQDCPGLGRHLPVLAYRQGHLAGGVQRQEFRCTGLPWHRVRLDPGTRPAELVQQQARLVAIARQRHAMHRRHHCNPLGCLTGHDDRPTSGPGPAWCRPRNFIPATSAAGFSALRHRRQPMQSG